MNRIIRIFYLFIIFCPVIVTAQKKDTLLQIKQPVHKNIIKYNPTSSLLFSESNVTFSYERILNPKRSFTFSAGYFVFPEIFPDTIANLIHFTDRDKYGFSLSAEYRRYLLSRNARSIPDGVYIAPFLSYYNYHFKNNLDILLTSLDSAGTLSGNFYILNLGIELGYQFVFKDRFTIDLVLVGPSVSYYGGSVNISGNVNMEDLKNINEDLYNKLLDRYPFIEDVVIDKTFVNEGKIDILSMGYRYLVQFGFFF